MDGNDGQHEVISGKDGYTAVFIWHCLNVVLVISGRDDTVMSDFRDL